MNEICKLDDIIPETGVCALVNGEQVAIFRTHHDEVYAMHNFDPFSKANVISRGYLVAVKLTGKKCVMSRHLCINNVLTWQQVSVLMMSEFR